MTQAPDRLMADDYAPCKFDACPCDPQCQRGECQHPAADRAATANEQEIAAFAMMQPWSNDRKQGYIDGRLAAQPADRAELAEIARWMHAAYDRPPQTPEVKAVLASIDALARSTDASSEPMTERDHFDFARWQSKLGELADAYYEAGRTNPARRRARAALMLHATDCATGWRARSALATPPTAATRSEPARMRADLDTEEATLLANFLSEDDDGESPRTMLWIGTSPDGYGLHAMLMEYPDEGCVLITSNVQPVAAATSAPCASGEGDVWKHAANEWADMAINGLQHARNLAGGMNISSPAEIRDNMEACLEHCRKVNDEAGAAERARALAATQAPAVPDERTRLRAAQASAVVPLIGPLLDAWECSKSLIRDECSELHKQLRAIDKAMDADDPGTIASVTAVPPEAICTKLRYIKRVLETMHPPAQDRADAAWACRELLESEWKAGATAVPTETHGDTNATKEQQP